MFQNSTHIVNNEAFDDKIWIPNAEMFTQPLRLLGGEVLGYSTDNGGCHILPKLNMSFPGRNLLNFKNLKGTI